MRIRALAAALLAGILLLPPLEAKRHSPKVARHSTSPRPRGRKAKRYKPRKVKPPKGERFHPDRPKPPNIRQHKHA